MSPDPKTPRGTIVIPAPVAIVNECALVLNYRRRPAEWEVGVVLRTSFHPGYEQKRACGDGTFQVPESWTYEVWIDRPLREDHYGRRRGGGYAVQVGDDRIRPLVRKEAARVA